MILVTGATGFIGKALCRRLIVQGSEVRRVVRHHRAGYFDKNSNIFYIGDIESHIDWSELLKGVSTIVHLAARVHVMNEISEAPYHEYERVNIVGTEKLALAAAESGVKRFVYLSTVKVNGEERNRAYTESEQPYPVGYYAKSKLRAENRLSEIAKISGMQLVILRPPLVYGPGVKANFLSLLCIVEKGLPLPLASIRNRRSLIFVENLVDVIALCCEHSFKSVKVYFVSDDQDISTPELMQTMAKKLEVPSRLFPFPPNLLYLAGKIIRKEEILKRLIGSLSIEINKIKTELDWQPPFTIDEGIQKTTEWYRRK